MDRLTGIPIGERADISQAIGDILTTPIGTRVERRDYGSALVDLIDSPVTPASRLRAIAAAIDAVERWEDRVHIDSGGFTVDENGAALLTLSILILADGSSLDIDVPFAAGGTA